MSGHAFEPLVSHGLPLEPFVPTPGGSYVTASDLLAPSPIFRRGNRQTLPLGVRRDGQGCPPCFTLVDPWGRGAWRISGRSRRRTRAAHGPADNPAKSWLRSIEPPADTNPPRLSRSWASFFPTFRIRRKPFPLRAEQCFAQAGPSRFLLVHEGAPAGSSADLPRPGPAGVCNAGARAGSEKPCLDLSTAAFRIAQRVVPDDDSNFRQRCHGRPGVW